jgi:hypothetical protein
MRLGSAAAVARALQRPARAAVGGVATQATTANAIRGSRLRGVIIARVDLEQDSRDEVRVAARLVSAGLRWAAGGMKYSRPITMRA